VAVLLCRAVSWPFVSYGRSPSGCSDWCGGHVVAERADRLPVHREIVVHRGTMVVASRQSRVQPASPFGRSPGPGRLSSCWARTRSRHWARWFCAGVTASTSGCVRKKPSMRTRAAPRVPLEADRGAESCARGSARKKFLRADPSFRVAGGTPAPGERPSMILTWRGPLRSHTPIAACGSSYTALCRGGGPLREWPRACTRGRLGGRLVGLGLDDVEEACRFAARVAALTCSVADPNPPWRRHLVHLVPAGAG
jgi:hypothetical protein